MSHHNPIKLLSVILIKTLALKIFLSIGILIGIWVSAGCTSNKTSGIERNDYPLTQKTPTSQSTIVPPQPVQNEPVESISPIATPFLTSVPGPHTSVTSTMGAVQITTFAPDANWRSETPDNIWWSDNSETLFYQDEISRLAWAYNIQTGIIESIPYVPRSIPELEIELSSRIPQNASLYAISQQKRHLLYTVPLTIPIPIELPITEDENSNPQFTRELWVLQNDQAYQLGLVDDCFLLHVPRWSKAENHAAVNTLFTPDIQHPCLFDVWWIDLISLKVEGLPFDQIINKSISVLDLAVDGDKVLISEAGKDGEQYIFDFETGDYSPIPNSSRTHLLIESDNGLALLDRTVEYGGNLEDYTTQIWYSSGSTPNSSHLASIKGLASQWSTSPNQKYVVYVISPRETYRGNNANVEAGIWLIPLP